MKTEIQQPGFVAITANFGPFFLSKYQPIKVQVEFSPDMSKSWIRWQDTIQIPDAIGDCVVEVVNTYSSPNIDRGMHPLPLPSMAIIAQSIAEELTRKDAKSSSSLFQVLHAVKVRDTTYGNIIEIQL